MTDAHRGTILVIEDDPAFRRFVCNTLAIQRYEVLEAQTGQQGLDALASRLPALIVLDLGLPDVDGLDLIRSIRAYAEIPILVVSSRSDESTQARALDLGADDYLTKPCTADELTARISTSVQGADDGAAGMFLQGALILDSARERVTLDGREIDLSTAEFEILRELLRHAGRAVTHSHLLRTAWRGGGGDMQHLRICIRGIREKIERVPGRPTRLLTEPGIGYRLQLPIEPA
jgi:two-component system KDP operon response regulator KdpE